MKQIKENAKTKMEKSINVMLSDFAGIRAGRAIRPYSTKSR